METGLEDRLVDLHSRVHREHNRQNLQGESLYRRLTGGNVRWGIAALEDKIVQQAVVTILNQIYRG